MSRPHRKLRAALPPHIRRAIDSYNHWDDSRDPSKLGALNLASYIGEQVAAFARRGLRKDYK